ncbi:GNAT family N-acetyltransferase [Paenibacillus beijingensis]|uniref:GCN5 family acetyltransferase n=1 Tax=Paenibacillus beijingensis TaxID=1126833 RepID=A0A0D5NNH7_9BACL|nr:GNAT family N-acetyltransferase [Paenibacillus beijingensis]AJY76695.1 GCN5 family acetyltransferase [Paenibacillus beijingensis]
MTIDPITMQAIRVTTAKQLEQCLAIRKEVFVEEQQVDIELEMDDYDASPASCLHILLTRDGQPVGTGRLIPYRDSAAKLQRIALRKPYRGTGAGKELVKALEDAAKTSGYTDAVLDAQCQAEPFYRKLGYAPVSPDTFLDAGILHIRMAKKL